MELILKITTDLLLDNLDFNQCDLQRLVSGIETYRKGSRLTVRKTWNRTFK